MNGYDQLVVDTVGCPACPADERERCVTPGGYTLPTMHNARRRVFFALRQIGRVLS